MSRHAGERDAATRETGRGRRARGRRRLRRPRRDGPGALPALIAALALVTAAAVPGAAQQATITGQVVDAETRRPIGTAQVTVPDLDRGTLTQANGRYLLVEVPPGTYEVVVQSIGHETARREVSVAAAETATADFEMRTRAVALDELVVTGVGVVQERRRLGQTINSVGTGEIEQSVSMNLTEALQGRIPGMVAQQPLGEVGASAPITLRGPVSISQRNDPVIYVDGVRVDNTHTRVTGVVTSPLNDINMADVERVEVIKGAAAATLYGTEASSGVIQITTKQGQTGAPRYSFQVSQEASHLDANQIPGNWSYDPGSGDVLYNHPASDFVETGWRQDYSLSARGGSPDVRYYASVRWMDQTGNLPVNGQDNRSLRSSLTFQHTDRLESQFNVNLTRNTLSAPNPTWGIVGEFVLADPTAVNEIRPYGELFHTVHGAAAQKHTQTKDHTNLAGQLSYEWSPNLRSEVQVGWNQVEEEVINHTPPGEALRAMEGVRDILDRLRTSTTVDLNTTWNTEITPDVTSSLAVGGQSFWESSRNARVGVRDFPSPGLRTLRGGSSVFAVDESMEEVINAGVFVQEQIGLQDRLFLTGGLRIDGNSAFGEEFGFQPYPKAGVSWVVSDHGFWNLDGMGWDHLRLRFAYGTSGLQPGAFDAQRTWSPVSLLSNDPAVLPQNLGNPDLKPERSIEYEYAAEVELLDGRLGAEVVYFHQRTEDALLEAPFPPSEGFLERQLTNVGELRSSGLEFSLDWAVVRRPNFSWDLSPQFSTLDQKVTDMGTVPDFRVTGGRRWNMIAEGYAPGAILAPAADPDDPYELAVPIEEFDNLGQISPNYLQNAAGEDSLVYHGDAIPTFNASLGSTLELPWNLRVRALFQGAAGFIMSNETELIRDAVGITERVASFQQKLADPNTTVEEKQRIADAYGSKHPNVIYSWKEEGDYLRFQELRVTHGVSEGVASRLGLGSLELSLAARNLALWTKYGGMNDPATSTIPGSPFTPNIDYFGQPVPSRFMLQVRGTW